MRQITDTQAIILKNLALFRFLTIDQMKALGITTGRSRTHLYRIVADLAQAPALIGRFAPRPIHGKGAFPSLHFLTKLGADMLAEMTQGDVRNYKFPKGKVALSRMLVHMTRCVWCEIHVRQWAEKNGQHVDWYFNDFDTIGDNRTGANGCLRKCTAIDMPASETLIPDAVFHMTDRDGIARLFLVEVHNEMRTKRIHEKLAQYREAIRDGAIARQFSYDRSPRVLAIFESEQAVSNAVAAIQKGGLFRQWEPFFFFRTLDSLEHSFREGWVRIDGSWTTAF